MPWLPTDEMPDVLTPASQSGKGQWSPTDSSPYDEQEKKRATAGDYLKAMAAGVNEAVLTAPGQLLVTLGADGIGRWLVEAGQSGGEYWKERMTPAAQQALRNPFLTAEGFGDTPFQTAALSAAQSLPGTAAMAIPGMAATRALRLARVPGRVAKALGGGRVARKIGKGVAPGLGFGAAEGVYSGLSSAAQAGQEVRARTFDELRKTSPEFRDLEASGDPTATPEQRAEAAREELAGRIEGQVGVRTALSTGAISAVTGGGALRLLEKPGKSVLRNIGQGAAVETIQETPQSAGEQQIQNTAMQRAGVQPEPGSVLNAAALGGAAGGILGGVAGGAGSLRRPSARTPAPELPPQTEPPAGALPSPEQDAAAWVTLPDGQRVPRNEWVAYPGGTIARRGEIEAAADDLERQADLSNDPLRAQSLRAQATNMRAQAIGLAPQPADPPSRPAGPVTRALLALPAPTEPSPGQVLEVTPRGVVARPGEVDEALRANTTEERARLLGYPPETAPRMMRADGTPFADQKKAATAIRNRRLDPARHRVVPVTGGFAIEEYDNAQAVRGDQGQADIGRSAGAGRQEQGGGDLQQPAQAGPEAGDGAAQGEAQGAAQAPVATAPKARKGKTEPRTDLAAAEQGLADAKQRLGDEQPTATAKPRKPLAYDPSTNRYNGEKLTNGEIVVDDEGTRYRLDRQGGFMLTFDKLDEKGNPRGIFSFSVDPTDKPRYRALYREADATSGRRKDMAARRTAEAEGKAPAVSDRRKDAAERQRVEQMTPDEMKQALLTDELTGLPNRRAYDEAPRRKHRASIDVDSLKFINDNFGHEAGDALLRHVGDALKASGAEAYRRSGDEFIAQGDDAKALADTLDAARSSLAGVTLEYTAPDGAVHTYTGPGFSYGIGTDEAAAEEGLKADKSAREAAGARAARGEKPQGVAARAPEGRQAEGGEEGRVGAEPAAAEQAPATGQPQPAGESAAPEPKAPSKSDATAQFANNTIFTADKVAAARERLRKKLGTLNSGIDPEVLVDGMTIAGAYIESGVREFSAYAKAMVGDLGDAVKPYLLSFYEAARHYPGLDAAGMTGPEAARAAHAALLAPADTAAPAIGTVAKKPKAGKKTAGGRRLRQDFGVAHIDGYSSEGEAAKDAFLADARAYLKDVAAILEQRGFTAALDRKGKPAKIVRVNEAGIAGSGDVSLAMAGPSGIGAYATIGEASLRGVVPMTESGVTLMFRAPPNANLYGGGENQWAPVDLTAQELADMMAEHVEAVASRAGGRRNVDATGSGQGTDLGGPEGQVAEGVQGTATGGSPVGVPGQDDADGRGVGEPGAGQGERGQRAGEPGDGGAGVEQRGERGAGSRAGAGDGGDRGDAGRPVSGPVDYQIPQGGVAREGSWKETARRNVEIVELVKRLEAEGRQATDDEKALLTRFTGWGASEIANGVFPDSNGIYKPGWEELGERLKAALSDDEYAAARRSMQYAHYTSEGVIRGIYRGLERLGFGGGTVLEPGMGIGLFKGMMPPGMAGQSQYTGVEYDPLTAAIAQKLYPASSVIVGDYAKTALPKDFFDVAIGNPPFSQTVVLNDPEYKKHRFLLHDYFFAKTLDRVRPGGLVVFVTSKGTMDKANDRARTYMAERADLLGAIRLPQTAFKGNAGTEVVTDVLFLRKRMPGEKPSMSSIGRHLLRTSERGEPIGQPVLYDLTNWKGLEEISTEQGRTSINEYFAQHPEMVLGRHALEGSMYRANEYTVLPNPGQDIDTAFVELLDQLPQNVFQPGSSVQARLAAALARDYNPDLKKEGGIYVGPNDVLMQVVDGVGVELKQRPGANGKPIDLTAKQMQWLRGWVTLRDALKVAHRDQLSDGPWEKSLADLQAAYAAFVKKHGHLLAHSRTEVQGADGATEIRVRFKNAPLFRMDAEGALVDALEAVREDGTIARGVVLDRRVLQKQKQPKIETVQDAMMVQLNRDGRLDLDAVATLAARPVEDAIEELGSAIYEAPGAGWQTADEYLSGNVVVKLAEARAAAKTNKRFERNVDALVAVQPAPLSPVDITVRLGTNWIPASDIEQFAREALGVTVRVTHAPMVSKWGVSSSEGTASEYDTAAVKASDVLHDLLNGRQIVVRETVTVDGVKRSVVNPVETEAANESARRMRQAFSGWIWSDAERARRLADYYNEHFNNVVPRQFDGSHLTLPGTTMRFSLRPHQKRAIWRNIQQGDTYYAHAVGAGKTFSAIAAGMEQKRLGLISKPLYVVPNHMLNQFAREFLELYPSANIMVADEHNFHTHNRRRFIAQAALNDPDAIIMTHSSFGRIGMSKEYESAYIKDLIADWEYALKELGHDADRITKKGIEQRIEQLQRRLEEKAATPKDQVMTFEELGADYLFVDEAHEFRKLTFMTNQSSIKGIDPDGSQRAMDLHMKVQYLRDLRPGRVLTMMSGTPVTNTMGELFTVQRMFQPDQMAADGLDDFDSWASMYGDVVTGLEQNAAGGYQPVSRFAKFVNVPELMARVRSFMDVLTSDQLGDSVTRPTVAGGDREVVIVPAEDGYREYQKTLEQRIKAIQNRTGPPKPGDDIILNVIADGRFSAIDLRFVDPTRPPSGESKLDKMLDQVIADYRASADTFYAEGEPPGATLMVFTDIGLGEASAQNRGFDMKAWIEHRLAAAGIPREHVAFMRDYKQHAKKEKLFSDMRAGRKRILIGGKDMETGVNVQRRLKYLYHLDAPWFPASIEQREGRIIRQGNLNAEVVVQAYATKGSYDATMWGMNARKQRFITQAMSGDNAVRSIDDVSESNAFEMAAALASGDERYLRLAGLRGDVERLQRLASAHHAEQKSLIHDLEHVTRQIGVLPKQIAAMEGALKTREPIVAGAFSATVDGAHFDSRDEFGEAVYAAASKLFAVRKVGEYEIAHAGGFPVMFIASRDRSGYSAQAVLSVPGDSLRLFWMPVERDFSAKGLAARIANHVNGIEKSIARKQEELETANRQERKLKSLVGAPYSGLKELAEKQAELSALEAEMAKESEQQPVAPEEGAEPDGENDLLFSRTDPVDSPEFKRWFGESVVTDNGKPMSEGGRPLVVYHGTTQTVHAPGVFRSGAAEAVAELERLASEHGIREWRDVPSIFERWVAMGMAGDRGVTQKLAEKARSLLGEARPRQLAEASTDLGFTEFRLPTSDNELGAHFGTREQAANFGEVFAFFLSIRAPLRLPDLGVWSVPNVVREARKQGVKISKAEYATVSHAANSAQALRDLLMAKGFDGVVYDNAAEGAGDSYIAFRPEQIKSIYNRGAFDPKNPSIVASRTTGGAGRSVESVRADLEQKLGKAALGRLSDRFVIVRDTQALRDDMQRRGSKYANQVDDTTKGLYDPSTQTSYIVAGNLAAGDSPWGVFLHEVGEHYGLERMLGREQHRQVLRDVTNLLRAGVKPVREAAIRVNAAESVGLDPTSPNFVREFANRMTGDARLTREVLAYLVENPANHNMPLYRRLLAAARAFLVRLGVRLKLNADDLVALVTAAARKSGTFARTAATQAVTDPQTADAMDALRQFGFTAKQEGGKWVIRDANGKVAKDSDIPESAQLAAWIVREAGPNAILRATQAPVWYSQLRRTLATDLPAKGPARQMAQAIESMQRKGRFKAEELQWSGVLDWLKATDGTVTRDEVLDQLDLNAVDVREVDLTEGDTKFEQYTLPGGENYREVLLTLSDGPRPKRESLLRKYGGDLTRVTDMAELREVDEETRSAVRPKYQSGHFNEPNILAHVRLNDRTDAQGRRVLFVEEVQSDWHQTGRKEGYLVKDEPLSDAERKEWSALRDASIQGRPHDSARFASLDRRATIGSAKEGVPDAPFKQSWPMLAMKRVLRMAADGGYDAVAWTTGEQQADRYDLRKQIDRVAITKTGGAWAVNAWRGGIKVITKDAPTDKDLENIVGKDLAARAVNDRGGEYSGLDLKVGGEGMAAFYDRMLPNELNKYVKKWGARVEEATIDIGEFKVNRDGHAPPFRLERVDSPTIISRHATAREAWAEAERLGSETVHAIELNDAMRDDITAGQPLFSRVRADDRLTAQALRDLLKGKPGITREVTENFNVWDRWLGTLDNLVRRNPAMRPFFQFGKELQKDRDGILADTNDVVAKWNAIGSRNPFQGQTEQQKKVGDALLDGTLKNRTWSDEELRTRGLTAPGIATYKGIRAYFERATAEYRNRLLERYGLTRDEAETLAGGGELSADAAERIGQGRLDLAMRTVNDFRALKGYFPLMRFGRHTVSVYNAKGELVHFETAENPLAHRTLANDLRGRFDASHKVHVGKLKPFTDEALVMDTRVLSMLRDYSEQASGLKDANGEALQILDDLEQAMLKTLADNSFQKHRIHRKGTPGFSRDIARVMANYGWSSANFLAKMRWMPKMESFVRGIDAHRMPDVKAHLERQIKYVRNPGEEFQAFKSATFAIYMGLNVKSAMVNLTQIPVTLYPYLANQHGDAKALGAIRKAMKDAASPRRVADRRLRDLFQWADHEGLTMDLYLSDLIGAARGKRQAQARLRNKTLEGATFLFSEAEKYNRRVALAAAYHLNKSLSDADLRATAQEVITKTQFDYGRFNRPTAFRGIGSIPLQFQQFMVNYLQFLAGNGGGIGATARSLAVVVAMAGLMGLPFAEDIRALFEYAYTKLTGEHLDTELAARERMVDLYESFGADPEGARRLTEMSLRGGFSMTPFDISGSVAAGRVIPGFKAFFDTAKDEGELAGFGRAISDAAGPLAGYGERVARGAEEAAVSGDVRHLIERAVPSIALSNAIRAFRVAREGVDRDYAGRVQIAYEPQELDVLAAALSFTPGERSRLYRMRNAERREGVFLTAAHQRLIVPYAVAIAERDQKRRREALEAIRAWNREVPAKWRLPMSKVIRSVQARRRQFEAGPKTGAGTTLRQLQPDIRQTRTLYPTRDAR